MTAFSGDPSASANLDIGKSHQHADDFRKTAVFKAYKLRHCQTPATSLQQLTDFDV